MTWSKGLIAALTVIVIIGILHAFLITLSGMQTVKVFSMRDPADDDYGDGGYVYPISKHFVKGCLDLRGFEVLMSSNSVLFQVNLSTLGDNPLNLSNGFSLQEVQVYVHVSNSPMGRTDTLGLNVWIRGIDSWQFMILANGLKPDRQKFSSGIPTSILVYYNGSLSDSIRVLARNNSIIITVPKALIPHEWLTSIKEWRYVVAVTPFNIKRPYGVMEYSIRATNESVGGVREDAARSGVQPMIMDLLAPNASVQDLMLSSYNSSSGKLAVIAAVPYARGFGIPQPPKTVTLTQTTTETLHKTLTKYVYGTETVTKALIREYYGVTTWWLVGLSMVLLIILAALMERRK